MEQRDLKELLILLKYYIIRQKPDIFYGMCIAIDEMLCRDILTYSEYVVLRNFLKDNKPKGLMRLDFWFPKGEKQPRIDWLNNEIYKL